MARRTVSLPDSTEALVRRVANDGESFSATVTRLIEAGAKSLEGRRSVSYVGAGKGPEELGRKAEAYLEDLVSSD
ncbi:hypothetical protein BH20ACT23_BH20ACT23_30180 [soil metagenome]